MKSEKKTEEQENVSFFYHEKNGHPQSMIIATKFANRKHISPKNLSIFVDALKHDVLELDKDCTLNTLGYLKEALSFCMLDDHGKKDLLKERGYFAGKVSEDLIRKNDKDCPFREIKERLEAKNRDLGVKDFCDFIEVFISQYNDSSDFKFSLKRALDAVEVFFRENCTISNLQGFGDTLVLLGRYYVTNGKDYWAERLGKP